MGKSSSFPSGPLAFGQSKTVPPRPITPLRRAGANPHPSYSTLCAEGLPGTLCMASLPLPAAFLCLITVPSVTLCRDWYCCEKNRKKQPKKINANKSLLLSDATRKQSLGETSFSGYFSLGPVQISLPACGVHPNPSDCALDTRICSDTFTI